MRELILRSQGAFPPGFYLPREGWVYCPMPAAPQKGNADGTEGIFGTCRMRVGYGPAPGPTIKRPCAILARSVGRATNTACLMAYQLVLVGWLVGWFLWHINLCRLFNAKPILLQIISSISNNFVCLFVLVLWHINICRLFNAKPILLQIISSISNNFVCLFVLVLWHINLYWLFNAKPILLQIISSISNNFVCLFGFYGISTFVGYLIPNPFIYK